MKKIILIILIAVTILSFQGNTLKIKEIHLSYNIINKNEIRKFFDKKGFINFYIKDEHFKTNKKPITLKKCNLKKIKLVNIDILKNDFLKKRKKNIRKSQKKGVIKILNKNEVYQTIYLYEKNKDLILKYKVEWIEEVLN